MKKRIFILCVALLLCMGISVNATEDIQKNNSSSFEFQNNITWNDKILGSAMLLGDTIKASGEVDGLSLLGGRTVRFDGTTEYLIGVGETIDINGMVNKDTLLGGNHIMIDADAVFGRDVTIGGNNMKISGVFHRDVNLIGMNVTITDATFMGKVTINAPNITIEENTSITGTLHYNDDAQIEIDSSVQIGNKTTFHNEVYEVTIVDQIKNFIVSWFQAILVFVVMLLIMPKVFEKLIRLTKDHKIGEYVTLFGKGFIALLLIPTVSILLLISMLGTALGMILIPIYIILIYISLLLFGYIVGNYIWKYWLKKETKPIFVGLLGITAVLLAIQLPYLGIFITFISLCIAFGLIMDLLFKKA